jgi:hypothetical protein
MSLPGLLIEYLVSGTLSLVWLYQFVSGPFLKLEAWQAPLVAAALYVVGMAVDLIAFWSVWYLKPIVHERVARRIGMASQLTRSSSTARQVYIQRSSQVIATELAARSSRDRIARGTFVNVTIAAAIGVPGVSRWWLAVAAVVALGMWCFFESTSHLYEPRACNALGYNPNSGDA